MIGHTQRVAAALLTLPVQVTPIVDWSRGRGYPWQPLRVVSGSHTIDATQQVRWQTSGVFMKDYRLGSSGIDSEGCRMRVQQELNIFGFGKFLVPAGVYSITEVDGTDDATCTLDGSSFETDCIDSTFPVARSFPSLSTMTMRQQAEALILEAVPDATFIWDDTLQYVQPMPAMQVDSDRWATVDGAKGAASIAGALGAEVFCNSFGAFHFRAVPTLNGPVVGTVQRGETLIEPSATQDRQGVFNVAVVTGTPADGGATIGPAFSWDNDPTSRTYAGPDPINHPEKAGLFGVKPYRYDNPLITSVGQGGTAGKALLSVGLGAHEVVTVDARFNPFYEPGDILVVPNLSGSPAPKLIDTISITWGAEKMSMATRSPKEDLS